MKILSLLPFSIILFIYLSFSNNQIDSLNNLIEKSKSDTNKVNLLNQVAFKLVFANPEIGKAKSSEALDLAKKLGFKFGEARAYNNLALNLYNLGEFDKAIEHLNTLAKISKTNKFDLLLTFAYGNLANIYTTKGEYTEALKYYELQLEVATKINNFQQISSAVGNTGNIYNDFGDFPKALEFYFKALKIYQYNNIEDGVSLMYGNIGNVYAALKENDKAMDYYKKACDIDMKLGNSIAVGRHYSNMGLMFDSEKKYEKAIEYYNKALKIYEEKKYGEGLSIIYINIAGSYTGMQKFDIGIEYFNKALQFSKEINDISNLVIIYGDFGLAYLAAAKLKPDFPLSDASNKQAKLKKSIEKLEKAVELNKTTNLMHKSIMIYKGLSEAYELLGNHSKALVFYKLHKEANDSVFNQDKKTEIVRQELNYYHTMELQKNQIEQLKKETKAKEEKNRLVIIISIVSLILILILIITFFLFRANKIKKANNIQLEEKNQQISQQNIELTTLNEQLAEKNQEISHQNTELFTLNEQLTQNQIEISRQNSELEIKNVEINMHLEKLTILNTKLSDANATKDKFFSIIAHDLKNPISALISGSDLLFSYYQRFTDEERINKIKQLSESSRFLFKMLENLLQWSRSQTGSIVFQPKLGNLVDIINSNIELSKLTANTKNIEIVSETPDQIMCNFDEDMITTVIRNITSNALKFTPSGGKITLQSKIENHFAIVSIEDTGFGISQENINKLFRIDSTFSTPGTNKEKGTGLGLLLCKEFIDKHNGKIWVESELNKGSKFIFHLPI